MSNGESVTVMFFYDGFILGVERKGRPGDYGHPGGKVEPGETYEQAAAREVLEETGVTIDISRLSVVHMEFYEGFLVRTFLYRRDDALNTEFDSGWRNQDGCNVRWIPLSWMLQGSFGSYNTRAIASVIRHLMAAAEKVVTG